jgi:hypothetical protein
VRLLKLGDDALCFCGQLAPALDGQDP